MTSSLLTFAFVFARGGSKGLPGKNLLPIGGHPLFAHGIRIAHEISEIASIFVSTDCHEIADIAASYGAEVIMRPAHLASDTAPEWLAWQHAIQFVQSMHGVFDRFLSLPPTAPCRSVEDVRRCLGELSSDVDLVLTTTPSHWNPWFNMVVKDTDGFLKLASLGDMPVRRQDAPDCSDIATVAYVSRPSFILQANGIWDGRIRGIEVPRERAIDVDTHLDYAIARFVKEQYIPSFWESNDG